MKQQAVTKPTEPESGEGEEPSDEKLLSFADTRTNYNIKATDDKGRDW